MELRDYLHKNRMKVADFCRIIDYSGPYMYRIVNQQKPAGRRLALTIVKATNGEVTYAELTKLREEETQEQKEVQNGN